VKTHRTEGHQWQETGTAGQLCSSRWVGAASRVLPPPLPPAPRKHNHHKHLKHHRTQLWVSRWVGAASLVRPPRLPPAPCQDKSPETSQNLLILSPVGRGCLPGSLTSPSSCPSANTIISNISKHTHTQPRRSGLPPWFSRLPFLLTQRQHNHQQHLGTYSYSAPPVGAASLVLSPALPPNPAPTQSSATSRNILILSPAGRGCLPGLPACPSPYHSAITPTPITASIYNSGTMSPSNGPPRYASGFRRNLVGKRLRTILGCLRSRHEGHLSVEPVYLQTSCVIPMSHDSCPHGNVKIFIMHDTHVQDHPARCGHTPDMYGICQTSNAAIYHRILGLINNNNSTFPVIRFRPDLSSNSNVVTLHT
jgi:hypothetical protein